MIDYLRNNFGDDGIVISLKYFTNYYSKQEIYISMISTLALIQNLLISIIIPLVAIIVLIMS